MISIRRGLLVLWDIFSVCAAGFVAMWLRFDGQIPLEFTNIPIHISMFLILTAVIVFLLFRLYTSVWHYASVIELKNVVLATFIITIADVAIFTAFDMSLPKSWYPINWLLLMSMVGASRFFYRIIRIVLRDK